ncbi:hypothetical protein CFOL_v3_16709 [Cephalotus follicularis]|uniref:Uncharacterized protein n=1 Tax=Cephalotus follicularis TaxID=3775 RepID=A0A1Q3BZN2_CEPFO|nr:hypothetical protein CFOL_v3_16709 [Cephalotus follicularis]
MASLQASTPLFSFSSPSCSSKKINAVISVPNKLPNIRFSVPKLPSRDLVEDLGIIRDGFSHNFIPLQKIVTTTTIHEHDTARLYAILEAVADRIEMHKNIGEQRQSWNTLLLNAINMITLTAATVAGVAATGGVGASLLALKLSSTLLFSAATGMLVIMNRIQPSQLVEEQRNATRLFKQLQSQLQSILAMGGPTQEDVNDAMDKVLALDKAYPLPLLGAMLEKFPKTFEPSVWWPRNQFQRENKRREELNRSKHMEENGWSEGLEGEMREIVQVLKRKDSEEYMKLGNLVLKVNKVLAISGPLLTGIAAAGSAFVGNGSWGAVVAVVAGALASTVNTLEHGVQVGMVFEMYRNSAGFFKYLEESIESTLNESEVDKRENGQLFEMKVALQLGRSLSQLRDLAKKSSYSSIEEVPINEFASKLF